MCCVCGVPSAFPAHRFGLPSAHLGYLSSDGTSGSLARGARRVFRNLARACRILARLFQVALSSQGAQRPHYWLLSPSEDGASSRPSVVVMQPIEDRVCDDTTICLGCSRHGLFLPKALVWPSLVEEADVLRDEAQQMVLPEHEHMVEQFAPQ